MPSFLKTTGILARSYLVSILTVGIAATLLVTILPEPGGRRLNGHAGFGSLLLYYTVWLVAGCFAGVFYTAMPGFEEKPAGTKIKQQPLMVVFSAVLFSIATIIIFYLLGEMPSRSMYYYVPGHISMTYTFFGSFLVTCLLFRKMNE